MPLFRVTIEGDSMWPELVPGKYYWASGLLSLRKGDCIVFKNTTGRMPAVLVKKVSSIKGNGYIADGVHLSSASYYVPRASVIGKLINP